MGKSSARLNDSRRCTGKTKEGKPCTGWRVKGQPFCYAHYRSKELAQPDEITQARRKKALKDDNLRVIFEAAKSIGIHKDQHLHMEWIAGIIAILSEDRRNLAQQAKYEQILAGYHQRAKPGGNIVKVTKVISLPSEKVE
jgi:hypothetical protein